MEWEVIDPDFSKITEGTIFKKALEDMDDKIVEENIEMIGMMVTIEVGTDQERGHFQEIVAIIGIEVWVIADQGQDPGMSCLACSWLVFVRCPSKHNYCKTDHDWLLL